MDLVSAEKLGNIVVSIVTVLAIVCGSVFALVEYLDYKKSEKILRSLSLVTRHQTTSVLKYRLEADSAWQDIHPELMNHFEKDMTPGGYEAFVLAVVQTKNLEESISTLFGFYEETAICVRSKLCDKSTIENYFLKSGRTFFNKFYPYVCDQRKKWNDPSIWVNVQKHYNPQSMGKICI